MDTLSIILFLSILALLPLIAVISTSFLKISVVLMFVRESLSLQQIPSNMVIYGMSLILSIYTMGPVYNEINNQINVIMYNQNSTNNFLTTFNTSKASVILPLKTFLYRNTEQSQRTYFYKMLLKMWKQPSANNVQENDIIILLPTFMVSQLNEAFKIGFLLYLPSLIIDIFISNILIALGMMMMSPTTISLPLKLLFFILIGGWSKVIDLLLNSFTT